MSGSWKEVNKYMQEGGTEGIRKTDRQDIARNSENVRIVQLQASTWAILTAMNLTEENQHIKDYIQYDSLDIRFCACKITIMIHTSVGKLHRE